MQSFFAVLKGMIGHVCLPMSVRRGLSLKNAFNFTGNEQSKNNDSLWKLLEKYWAWLICSNLNQFPLRIGLCYGFQGYWAGRSKQHHRSWAVGYKFEQCSDSISSTVLRNQRLSYQWKIVLIMVENCLEYKDQVQPIKIMTNADKWKWYLPQSYSWRPAPKCNHSKYQFYCLLFG